MDSGPVLLVSNHAEIIGGGEISMLTLVEGLTETAWQPIVAVPGDGAVASRCRELRVAVHETPLPSIRHPSVDMLGARRTLKAVVEETDCRIVHTNGSRAMFYAGLAARRGGRPVIWHLRIKEPDPRLDSLLVRLASDYIATSGAVRDRLTRWPAARDRCRVIPNGLDLESFVATDNRHSMREKLGLDTGDFVVACVSRLVDFKRHDLLLEAIAGLRSRLSNVSCLVVGAGPEEDRIRARAAAPDLAGSVVFAGHREDVSDLLTAADVFVLPTPSEHFGRVVIEAMAAGVPVVAANAAGPAEIIVDDESGMLVQPGDAAALAAAIEALYDDPERRRRIGRGGRRRVVERYTMRRHADDVAGFYSELTAPASR